MAWRRCGSLLGGCHSGESQLRAVGVLRHVVCELSDLIELRPSGLEVPLAEGASEPPVTPEEQDRTGLRSRSSGERPSKERQPDPSPDKRDKGTKAKSTERTQEGTSAETLSVGDQQKWLRKTRRVRGRGVQKEETVGPITAVQGGGRGVTLSAKTSQPAHLLPLGGVQEKIRPRRLRRSPFQQGRDLQPPPASGL